MVYFTADEICETLQTAGLCDVDVVPVASLASIQDDIGNEQLITFRRRASGRSFRVVYGPETSVLPALDEQTQVAPCRKRMAA